ncbi:futalosine hydrolase [Aneurinibacillus sp. BA2021]|nr:futalosine hydrolase [Aneurinibacillus sp. BA2021]
MEARFHSERRVLVMTSVAAERDAVLRGLGEAVGFDVRVAGVGPAAAAASTAAALASGTYRLVINAGIAGGFAGRAAVGSLVIADEIVAADLGAETPGGFISVDELGFGSARVPVDLALAQRMAAVLSGTGLPVTTGAVLSVSTVTGTAETAAALAARIPRAAAEAMEGYGVATAAQHSGVPVLELRAISNPVGPRDRAAWRITEALQALQTASSFLPEVVR